MKFTRIGCAAGVAVALGSFASMGIAHDSAGSPARLGKVSFKVECNEAAQREFNVAMSYYHSFAWNQMQAPVENVLKNDPSCGMAHWVRALGSLNNPFAWPNVISPAVLSEGPRILQMARDAGLRSQRERDYVDALAVFFQDTGKLDHRARAKALEVAMEQLAQRYPADSEASTLYALILSANFDPADKKYVNQLRAAKILEPIFQAQPEHPGVAHYLIHSYDYPPIAKHGLEAAKRYGKIAPDAAHALHMPSHIFTRVGAWKDSIESNRASARIGGDKSFDKWHAYDYMVYAHLQLGQDGAARQVVAEALGNPARIDHPAKAYAYAAMPARLLVERAAWKEAAGLGLHAAGDYPWKKYSFAEAINAYARGIGSALSGDAAGARRESERLKTLQQATKVPYWVNELGIQADTVAGLALCAEGNRQGCLGGLRAAADREDASEKSVVTPGRLVPVRELLGYALLDAGEPIVALREFEAVLEHDPNRLRAYAGAARAAEAMGSRRVAADYSARLLELTASADTPLGEIERARQVAKR